MSTSTVPQLELGDDVEDGGGLSSERNPGRLWEMDQRIDKPLGAEADHVRSMYLNQVQHHKSHQQGCPNSHKRLEIQTVHFYGISEEL